MWIRIPEQKEGGEWLGSNGDCSLLRLRKGLYSTKLMLTKGRYNAKFIFLYIEVSSDNSKGRMQINKFIKIKIQVHHFFRIASKLGVYTKIQETLKRCKESIKFTKWLAELYQLRDKKTMNKQMLILSSQLTACIVNILWFLSLYWVPKKHDGTIYHTLCLKHHVHRFRHYPTNFKHHEHKLL